jgi:hypothetical protein
MWFGASIQEPLPIKGVVFNFMPSWWYRNYGIEYGERMIFDPDYRVETHRAMRRIMAERFGAMHLGERDPQPCVTAPDWQNASTSAFAGCDVDYPKDNYPIGRHLPEDKLDNLHVPRDLWSVFPYNETARQVAYLNRRFNTDAANAVPTRGILNEAVILRGDALFLDMFVNPDRAQRVLDFSFNLMRRQLETNGGGCTICNCTVPLIGPRSYDERIFDLDRGIAEQCGRQGGPFGIHHCGRFDEYATSYRRLSPAVAWVQIGHASDVRRVLELFPEAAGVDQLVEATLINSGTPAEVGARVDRILEATRGHWHRLSLSIADIDYGAPDENMAAVYEHLKRAV